MLPTHIRSVSTILYALHTDSHFHPVICTVPNCFNPAPAFKKIKILQCFPRLISSCTVALTFSNSIFNHWAFRWLCRAIRLVPHTIQAWLDCNFSNPSVHIIHISEPNYQVKCGKYSYFEKNTSYKLNDWWWVR